jgi:hypothetical protein
MNRQILEAQAQADFLKAVGTVIEVQWVYGYNDRDDSVDIPCAPPAKVRVLPTPDEDLKHWIDGRHLDPYWNVEAVEPDERLEGVRSLWVFGPSYEATT